MLRFETLHSSAMRCD